MAADLILSSDALRADVEANEVGIWIGVGDGKGRGRKADLLVAKPRLRSGAPPPPKKRTKQKTLTPVEGDLPFNVLGAASDPRMEPDEENVRLFMEHKSTLTAHRNKTNRQDDLNNLSQQMRADPGVITAATVMVGTSRFFLNVADLVKPRFYSPIRDPRTSELQFAKDGSVRSQFDSAAFAKVVERIRNSDATLPDDFWFALSGNGAADWHGSVEHYRTELKVRAGNRRDEHGYDAVLIVPVNYSNLAPCSVNRENDLGIDPDAEYADFVHHLASLYTRLYGGPVRRARTAARRPN